MPQCIHIRSAPAYPPPPYPPDQNSQKSVPMVHFFTRNSLLWSTFENFSTAARASLPPATSPASVRVVTNALHAGYRAKAKSFSLTHTHTQHAHAHVQARAHTHTCKYSTAQQREYAAEMSTRGGQKKSSPHGPPSLPFPRHPRRRRRVRPACPCLSHRKRHRGITFGHSGGNNPERTQQQCMRARHCLPSLDPETQHFGPGKKEAGRPGVGGETEQTCLDHILEGHVNARSPCRHAFDCLDLHRQAD